MMRAPIVAGLIFGDYNTRSPQHNRQQGPKNRPSHYSPTAYG